MPAIRLPALFSFKLSNSNATHSFPGIVFYYIIKFQCHPDFFEHCFEIPNKNNAQDRKRAEDKIFGTPRNNSIIYSESVPALSQDHMSRETESAWSLP